MNVDYTHAPQVDHIDCEASRMVNKILILADCANLASITITGPSIWTIQKAKLYIKLVSETKATANLCVAI